MEQERWYMHKIYLTKKQRDKVQEAAEAAEEITIYGLGRIRFKLIKGSKRYDFGEAKVVERKPFIKAFFSLSRTLKGLLD